MNNDSQLAFDLDELVREDLRANPPEWQGAPLHFTTDYFSPGELQAAFEHWQLLNGRFGSIPHSRMWHTGYGWLNGGTEYGDHRLVMFSADLRPEPKCEGPGDLMYLAVCEPCEWHQVSDSEIDSVEGWHNHAIPNWRELPVVPAQIRVRDGGGFTKLGRKWIAAHYPPRCKCLVHRSSPSAHATRLDTSPNTRPGAAMTSHQPLLIDPCLSRVLRPPLHISRVLRLCIHRGTGSQPFLNMLCFSGLQAYS